MRVTLKWVGLHSREVKGREKLHTQYLLGTYEDIHKCLLDKEQIQSNKMPGFEVTLSCILTQSPVAEASVSMWPYGLSNVRIN